MLTTWQAGRVLRALSKSNSAFRVRAEHTSLFRYVVTGVDLKTHRPFVIESWEEWKQDKDAAKHDVQLPPSGRF